MNSSSDVEASWEKFLNPESLKQNLLQGGLYLAAFEMLKDSLLGRPRDFFCIGFSDGQFTIAPEYTEKVLSLHKRPYTASALWWHNQGAISKDEVEKLRLVREHRDQIAHNMPKMIGTVKRRINMSLLVEIDRLLSKIDNWWIQNIEASIMPEQYEKFSQGEMDAAASVHSFFLSMMISLVAGDDSQFRKLHEMWCAQKKNRTDF